MLRTRSLQKIHQWSTPDSSWLHSQNPGVPPKGYGIAGELGNLARKESKRRGRQRKNDGTETQWEVAAVIAVSLSHSVCDSKSGLPPCYTQVILYVTGYQSYKRKMVTGENFSLPFYESYVSLSVLWSKMGS